LQIKQIIKRRKGLLFVTPIFFVLLSIGLLYLVDPIYKSSVSILVQEENTIDPLVLYEMPEKGTLKDRLESFNEIIYSRTTIEQLIDSINLEKNPDTEKGRQPLVDQVRKNISTSLKASDSFEITFSSNNPHKARDGVAFLANYFINTQTRLTNRKNYQTVNFFQKKLKELENIVENHRNKVVNATKKQIKKLPLDQELLQKRLQDIDQQLVQLEWQIIKVEDRLKVLQTFLDQQQKSNLSVEPLYKLSLEELTLGDRLGNLLQEFNEVSQKFTADYPELQKLKTKIIDVVKRISPAVESELTNLKKQQQKLIQQRTRIIDDMEKAFVAKQQNNNKESNISVYQDLYDQMKVKLEQVRITREIEEKDSAQFKIVDSPFIAREPSFPNRKLVLGSGVFLGLVFAVLLTSLAEFFDTTIRKEQDLELQKPIIAYLTDGKA